MMTDLNRCLAGRHKLKNGLSLALCFSLVWGANLEVAASAGPGLAAGKVGAGAGKVSVGASKVAAAGSAKVQLSSERLVWRDFDNSVFEQARAEKKFVLLDLAAVWCHWCHVMDEETYSNAEVIRALNKNYICVRVDQDSRPDLANKYEDYGWPATIIFAPDGTEIVKRAGYLNPQRMQKLLAAIVRDPSPEDSTGSGVAATTANSKEAGNSATAASTNAGSANAASTNAAAGQAVSAESGAGVGLPEAILKELKERHVKGYDSKYGGWGTYQKFLDWDSCEYAMELAADGDHAALERVKGALDGQLNLIDPAFGGVYQYSTDGDWQHPHYEKIMQMQAENLRAFSLGYMLTKDKRYLEAASSIKRYLEKYLGGEDGFYTSQDADLVQGRHGGEYFQLSESERLKKGLPRIDKHIYARENGWAIAGLAAYYAASQDEYTLPRAMRAARWIMTHRARTLGGFSHDEQDKAGPFLGDTLAMGRGFLALYEVTGERQWLAEAIKCADFIDGHFRSGAGKGYISAAGSGPINLGVPLADENIMLARFANKLQHFTGKKIYRDVAERAMAYLAQPDVALKRKVMVGGYLLADRELRLAPLHITVVGPKGDVETSKLFRTAIGLPQPYKRVEWFDKSEGPLLNSDVELPDLNKPAAFSCGNGICSRPAFDSEALLKMYERLRRTNE